jgi:iron(III) transport system permease protein
MAPGTSRITRPPGPSAQTDQAAGASPRRWSHLHARFTPERLALTVFTLAVVAAVAAPLVEVVLRSFQQQTGLVGSTWSTANYRQLSGAQILKSAENSAIIAVGATAIATVIGVALAWLVTRTDLPFRRAFTVLNLIPFFLSPLIGSIAWTYLGDPRVGLINRVARSIGLDNGTLFNVYSLYGIIVVLGLFLSPFVMLLCGAAFRQMDSSLEHAAQASGASTWRTTVRVTLPLAAPTIVAAAFLVFVLAVEDLSVPLVLGYSSGIRTLSTQIYDAIQNFPPNYNFGAALGCVMMLFTAACLLIQRRVLRNRGYVTVAGRASSQAALRLGRGRWVAFAAELLYLLIAAVAPIGILAVVAFSQRWTGRIDFGQLTLHNFSALFGSGSTAKNAFVNSLELSALCACVVVAVSVVVVYALERARITGRRLFEVCLTVPVAVPGLALAVGMLTLLLHSPLFGTLWIIGLAYVVRYLALAHRSVSAAFGAVSQELEEAARLSGAAWFGYARRVLLPLLRPGLTAGWLLTFLTFMKELPMSALLQTTGTQTLSVALLNSTSFDSPGEAAAFTLLQAALLLVVAGAFWAVATRGDDDMASLAVGM